MGFPNPPVLHQCWKAHFDAYGHFPSILPMSDFIQKQPPFPCALWAVVSVAANASCASLSVWCPAAIIAAFTSAAFDNFLSVNPRTGSGPRGVAFLPGAGVGAGAGAGVKVTLAPALAPAPAPAAAACRFACCLAFFEPGGFAAPCCCCCGACCCLVLLIRDSMPANRTARSSLACWSWTTFSSRASFLTAMH